MFTMDLPSDYHRFAFTQDQIGWDNFMLGKISNHLRPIQYSHLLVSPSLMTVDDWMAKLINKLLHIVHGQWIYRNISKHHHTLGSIRRAERRQLLLEIDRLMSLDPNEIPEESKFLLEVDFAQLRQGEVTTQHYWVHAVKAAIVAGQRKVFLQKRRAAPSGRRPLTREPPLPYGPADIRDSTEPKTPKDGGSLWSPPVHTQAPTDRETTEPKVTKRTHRDSGSIDDKSNKRRKPD